MSDLKPVRIVEKMNNSQSKLLQCKGEKIKMKVWNDWIQNLDWSWKIFNTWVTTKSIVDNI